MKEEIVSNDNSDILNNLKNKIDFFMKIEHCLGLIDILGIYILEMELFYVNFVVLFSLFTVLRLSLTKN
jgi:hypothetical protein